MNVTSHGESTLDEIEKEELKPSQEYKRKLDRYENRYCLEIQRKYPVSEPTRNELKGLQRALRLTDENIDSIENRVNKEILTVPNLQQKNLLRSSIFLVGAFGCVGIGVLIGWSWNVTPIQTVMSCQTNTQLEKGLNISLGEKILLKGDTNAEKQAGVEAFSNKDFPSAIDKFKLYRQKCRTDPEALIYLNNAEAAKKGNFLKIATSVPIGSNQNVAKEILRGVAQAQDEVNRSGGIEGRLLQVAIANDDNNPSLAPQVAAEFVKDSSIVAVVGHNATNATIPAAPVYQSGRLVMISPTTIARNLSNIGSYIFRTVPTVDSIAERLTSYIVKTTAKTNILICVDSSAIDNVSYVDAFTESIGAAGGKVDSTNCDLAVPKFNPNVVISQAISSGKDGLLLAPHIDKIDKALDVARVNKGQLPLFGTPSLTTYQTLQAGLVNVNGMVLALPWYPTAIAGNPFLDKAMKLWGGVVNWRTATAYDATKAILMGLQQVTAKSSQQSNMRDELQKELRNPKFSARGATGKIEFLPSGDRKDIAIFLVKVQPNYHHNTDYAFMPLPETEKK